MNARFQEHLTQELTGIQEAGLTKRERIIGSQQGPWITLADGRRVLNLCANNYLGLATHPEVVAAAHDALDRYGYGLASVRFICGTQDLHKTLEQRLSEFLGMDDTILFSSCWDANGGVFETLLGPADAVISDALNHASIIDGVRLCKARRFRYRNNDMTDLEEQLREAADARLRLIVTDGVFSMDGTIADLPGICALAERYDALVMVDDSHAVGFLGDQGRGTPDYYRLDGRVDILTGTLGKALGGASGGYVCGSREMVELLRQKSRPYLFSNTLAPAIAGATLKVLELLTGSTTLRDQLEENTRFFRQELAQLGYDLLPGHHPIIPIMFGAADRAGRIAEALLEKGLYVIPFSYPVVPHGQARIRTQVSAAHSRADLEFALQAFASVRHLA